jgi:hypothetical protein
MALVLADRVKETTTTTGTGAVTLLGASTGFQSFSAVGNSNTTYYTIAHQTLSEWEVGIGTYTSSGTTLSRTTVLSSSNAGSLVNFSAGTKDVFVTYPSSRSIYADGTTLTATNSSVLPVASGGTGLSSGTSGGVPYYSSTSAITSSAALASNALVVGGGAGAAPATVTTGTGVVTALGVNTGTAGAFVVNGGALGTPSSGTVTNLTGTASININGTVGATTASTGAFTTLSSTGNTTLGDATTDTVTVNGYMGVGGAATADRSINILGTSTATNTVQEGIRSAFTANSTATAAVRGFVSVPTTQAAAFTVSNMAGFWAATPSLGAGSAVTNLHGIYIANQTGGTNNYGITSLVSSGTDKWNIYASGTAANYLAGQLQLGDGSAAAPALSNFGDDNTGIFFPAADTIAFTEGGTEAMRIDSSGNVGIGTTAPTQKLEVAAPINTNSYVKISATGTGASFLGLSAGSATNELATNNGGDFVITSAGVAGDVFKMVHAGAVTSTMVLTGGNVGIGTTSPTTALTLGTSQTATVQNGGSNSAPAYAITSGALGINGITAPAANTLAFVTGSGERVRIDSSGNVGIGTTSPAFASGTGLEVQRTGDATVRVERTDATASAGEFVASSGLVKIGATGSTPFTFITDNTERMRVTSNGDVGIGTSSPIRKLTVSTAGTAEFVLQDTSQAADSRNWRIFNAGNTLYFGTLNDAGSSGTDAVKITSTANLQFNSGYGSVATAYGCRAWVSFTGSTAAIRGSANVSSITRNGTGNYVVNYSTAMPDINYSAVASCSGQGSTNGSTNCILVNASAGGTNVAPTTTATTLFCYHPGNQVAQDTAYINFAVFR